MQGHPKVAGALPSVALIPLLPDDANSAYKQFFLDSQYGQVMPSRHQSAANDFFATSRSEKWRIAASGVAGSVWMFSSTIKALKTEPREKFGVCEKSQF
jgi:hypothetical protein